MMKKFNHNFIKVPKLKQINTEQGRRYEIEGQNIKYPSITTILSKTRDNQWLIEWRKRIGEDNANQITRNATTRGTALHSMCEHYLLNKDVSTDNVAADFMFRGIRSTLDRMDNVRALETTLYSHSLRVAGTVDCVAELDNKLAIIDFKTASKPKSKEYIEDYFLQGCFYFTSFYEITNELPSQITILITVQDGTCQEFTLKGSEIIYYTEKLKERIAQYYEQFSYTTNA